MDPETTETPAADLGDNLFDQFAGPETTPSEGPDLLDEFVSGLTAEEEPAPAATEETTKPEETPAATEEPAKPEDDPETPKTRKAADWDTLRGSRDKYRAEAEEKAKAVAAKEQELTALQQKIADAEAKAARLPELEEKLKLLDEYEKELAVSRIEATKEFKDAITEPLKVLGKTATEMAEANGTDAADIRRMIQINDPSEQRAKFKELTAGWDDVDRNELRDLVKDARVIFAKEDAMRENALAAKTEQESLQAKRLETERAESKKQFVAQTSEVIKKIRETTPFIPIADGETEDDRYSSLAQKVAAVDFDSQPARGKAFAATTALLYPQMLKTVASLKAENEALKARVGQTNAAKPSVTPNQEVKLEPENTDFLVAMGVPNPNLSHSLHVTG